LLRPGQQAVLRFQVAPGQRLHLWCSVPGHRAQGMQATLAVASIRPP
jgi:uncharacterized cupredoxin-like copper-binding protein